MSDKVTKSVTVLKGKVAELDLTPPLKADFKPDAQTAERSARINVKVSLPGEADKVVYEDAAATTVYPHDQMPWSTFGEKIAGAWITPQSPAIEDFIAAAKKRIPGGALVGADQGPTLPQVKAIYDELKARGMTYVLATMGSGGQHVRLPAESIKCDQRPLLRRRHPLRHAHGEDWLQALLGHAPRPRLRRVARGAAR